MNSSNVLSFVLFADDTTVYVQNYSIDSPIEILNTEFAKVALWFDFNKLDLNVNKTQMIMLSRKKIRVPKMKLSYEMRCTASFRKITSFWGLGFFYEIT